MVVSRVSGPGMTITRLLTYLPSPDTAKTLAQSFLDARLIACANIGPEVTSLYTWQGKAEESPETQLWLKTTTALAPRVMAAIGRLPPHDRPRVAADQITANADYAQ